MGSNAKAILWPGLLAALALATLLPQPVRAASIVLETYELQADTANQEIRIYVSGADQVSGVIFRIETGPSTANFGNSYADAGGADVGVSGSANAPKISNVDLLASGSVFGSVANTGQSS